MAVIQMTPELLNEKAKELRGLRQEHDEAMKKMGTLIHGLDAIWKGESQTAYINKYDSMQGTFTSFSEMIEEYAAMMDSAARQMQEKDAEIGRSIG